MGRGSFLAVSRQACAFLSNQNQSMAARDSLPQVMSCLSDCGIREFVTHFTNLCSTRLEFCPKHQRACDCHAQQTGVGGKGLAPVRFQPAFYQPTGGVHALADIGQQAGLPLA
jgi:hypothetical protein